MNALNVWIRTRMPRVDGPVLLLLVALLVAYVLQGLYLVTYVQGQREVTASLACQVQVNDQFREALTLRTSAAARERRAQRDFLNGSLDGLTPAELNAYLRALTEADRDRANNPLPMARC